MRFGLALASTTVAAALPAAAQDRPEPMVVADPKGADVAIADEAMQGHVLAKGRLAGTCQRS